MTALKIYQAYIKALEPIYGRGESEAISKIVFEELGGLSRSDMIIRKDEPIGVETEKRLLAALKELQENKPVQYVTGIAWFCGERFTVAGDVLIPRPETEELVDKAIRFLSTKDRPSLIDIGTGSGCIAISLKKKLPTASVTAIDRSDKALRIARQNSLDLGTDIRFMEMDFLDECNWAAFAHVDCIISNPPYIPISEKQTMDAHVVRYEPGLALFVEDERPLIFYEKIAAFAKEHLAPNGMVWVETHENLAAQVCELFRMQGFESGIEKDVFGKDRMVWATRIP